MATPDVNGSKYWYNGLIIPGIQQSTKDTGTTKYWYNGLVTPFLASYGVTPPTGQTRFFVIFIN